jgi:glycosyltransferase involved in cell wall biosynthesis
LILGERMRKVSVCVITLWRDSLYKMLKSLFTQKTDNFDFEIILILQWSIDLHYIDTLNKNKIPLKVEYYEKWLWFSWYRNEAIKHASWDIIAWIDDDERTANNDWLIALTRPIFEQRYKVVTAWTLIELWKWYRTDCITYLWYPWWSVIGFDLMRTVNKDWTTEHLCSWNFAFHRVILQDVCWFDNVLKSGAEDVAFATRVIEKGLMIYREPKATIYHIHRSGIIHFCKWHFLRWKSVYEYMKLWLVTWWQKKDKLRSVKHILFDRFFTRYVFGIWFLFSLQYLFTLIGYGTAKIWSNSN